MNHNLELKPDRAIHELGLTRADVQPKKEVQVEEPMTSAEGIGKREQPGTDVNQSDADKNVRMRKREEQMASNASRGRPSGV